MRVKLEKRFVNKNNKHRIKQFLKHFIYEREDVNVCGFE